MNPYTEIEASIPRAAEDLCKEVEGFLDCHEMAISMDSGNSNMEALRYRIKNLRAAIKSADAGEVKK